MKKILFLLITLLVGVAFFIMPGMVTSSIQSVYYITPDKKTYENVVNCQGTIQSADVREIYLQSAVVPAEVLVEAGDTVNKGDMLVIVDNSMTKKITQNLISGISGDISGSKDTGGIDWASLASYYGLSAVLNGGSIDYSTLNNILQSGSGQDSTRATSGAIADYDSPDHIVSPMDGTIIDVKLMPQAPAYPGTSVFTIADTDNFTALALVGESDIAKINVGDEAKIRGVGFSGSMYNGVVTKIHPTAKKSLTSSETTVEVEIAILDPDKKLKPGFSAKVEITGGNYYDIITVPYEAIRQDENNDEYVYIYRDGKLKKQIVVTGQELTSDVEILGGLSHDSIVVYNPNGLIKEGSMINIKGRAGS